MTMSPAPPPVETPEWPQVARYAAIAALVALAVAGLLFVAPVSTIILAGVLIAVITGGVARWLGRRTSLGPVPAVIVVYVAFIALLLLAAVTVFPWLVRALEVLVAALRANQETAQAVAPTGAAATQLQAVFSAEQIERFAENVVGFVIRLLTRLLVGVGYWVYVLALGLFLSFLMHMDLGGRGLRLMERLPPAHGRELRLLTRDLVPLWTRFVGASFIFAAIVGVGSLVEFVILGVPYPLLMAALTALITPIPTVGGLLSSLIVGVVCLVFGSTRFPDMSPALFAGIVWILNSIITQSAYNFVLMPILGKAVRLPVSIVLIGVLASFAVNNILFAFIVVPVVASLRIVAEYLYAKIQRREPFPDAPS